jgi:hypothetical protein
MRYFLLGILALVGSACSNSGGQSAGDELTTKFKEVMVVHDLVMPRMQEVRKLNKALDALRSEAESDSSKSVLSLDEINAAADSLEIIEAEMMEWMHTFEADQSPETSDQERLKYLEERKLAMERVGEHFERNIQFVEELVK